MGIILFRLKTCPIPLSPILVAESLNFVAEVLTIFSLLFMTAVLFSIIGKISAAQDMLTDRLCTKGYLPFPSLKASNGTE